MADVQASMQSECTSQGDNTLAKTTDNKSTRPAGINNKSKKRKKTRTQRRKQQQTNERPERTDARTIIKENENLVKFYNEQGFFDENEFKVFMDSLRETLPASFRINTFDYGQAKILRRLVVKQFQDYLEAKDKERNEQVESTTNKEIANKQSDNGKASEPETVPTLQCLEWYPKKMAWQMNITRMDLRRSDILRSLHKFIQAETDNGYISRQESVSMIPPLVLDIKRGHNVLDMCAAPGSKTAQLLEYLKFGIHDEEPEVNDGPQFNDGLVLANDVDNKRCYMLVHQSSRLNSPNCVIINEDASRLPDLKTTSADGQELNLKFDRILCDAPCSGDGTVRKNPDVWRKWTIGNANNFHGLQSKILKRGVELLQKDGLIVYSTCSMNPVEDEAVVANILRLGRGHLVLEDCSKALQGLKYMPGISKWSVMDASTRIINGPDEVKPEQSSQLQKTLFTPSEEEIKQFNLHRCIRVFPHLQNTGAFFVAVIKKLSSELPHELKEADAAQEKSSGDRPHFQPKPKRRRFGFKEDPFIFLDDKDRDWINIKEFYGLADGFPSNQLTHRCKSGKKRSIYLVSKQTRSFILANQEVPEREHFVKVINGGMRLFMRAETGCGFRICQDGIGEILPFINPDLKVPATREDLIALLSRRAVFFTELSSSKQFSEKLRVGSCVLMYKHKNILGGDKEQENEVEMPLVAWRGDRSVALYVSNTYKVHLRSLIHSKIVSDDVVFAGAENDKDDGETKTTPVEQEQ